MIFLWLFVSLVLFIITENNTNQYKEQQQYMYVLLEVWELDITVKFHSNLMHKNIC